MKHLKQIYLHFYMSPPALIYGYENQNKTLYHKHLCWHVINKTATEDHSCHWCIRLWEPPQQAERWFSQLLQGRASQFPSQTHINLLSLLLCLIHQVPAQSFFSNIHAMHQIPRTPHPSLLGNSSRITQFPSAHTPFPKVSNPRSPCWKQHSAQATKSLDGSWTPRLIDPKDSFHQPLISCNPLSFIC